MTPRCLLTLAGVLVSLSSCSSAHKNVRVIPPAAGVRAAMERHVRLAQEVRNAVDAGEGDFEARQLRERLVANPGDVEIRLRLAARYEDLDMPELAIEHYRLAAERFPAESTPQIRLARALHGKGRTAEAAASIETYLGAYPEAPAEAHSWAGILRDALGHQRAAEHHHRDALERSASSAYLHNNLGQNLTIQKRENEAAAEFRAAIELEPSNVTARNNLALLLAAADPAQAGQVIESGTDDPATKHNNLAAILIDQGRYEEARRELNLALGYKPDHMAALANLSLVSELDGKPARVEPANGGSGSGGLRKLRRAFAKVFTASETRPPEQSADVKPPARVKVKRPSE